MKIYIAPYRISNVKIGLPRCDASYRFCMLVKRNFLTDEELKIISLLGFNIECSDYNESPKQKKHRLSE